MKSNTYLRQFLLIILTLSLVQETNSQTLRSLADAQGKYIGNLMSNGFFDDHQVFNGATDLIAKTEYNTLVLANKMKMSNLLRVRPIDPFNVQISDIQTQDIDRFVAYADANNMRKRGHVMVWYKQIPNWLATEAPTWTAQQIYDFSRSYILALSTYTAGKIDEWDVLNEAVLSSGYRTGTWYDKVNTQANNNGKIGYIEYFSSLFKWARQGDPNVPLFYNDYNIEPLGTNKNNFMRTMVKDMKNVYSTPIDGVGLQSHFSLSQITNAFINDIGKTIDDLAVSGFTVNLTELDIKICNGDGTTLEDQRIAYRDIVYTALSRSNCNTVLIWGMSDNDSWIPSHSPGCGQATPHDANFQKKPAYFGIQEALMSLQTAPPWDFNGTVENFVGSNYSSISSGATYATYNIVGTSPNPNLENSNAMIDTSVGNYIVFTIQNSTANTRVQVITNRNSSAVYTNFDGLTPNDTGFTTYYINMSGNSGWTGTLTEITFRFKEGAGINNVLAGDVLIDNIDVVASIPATPRIDYDFNDTSDAEGFVAANGVTLSQPIAGEIQLNIDATSPFPKFEQSGLFSVDATTYDAVQVTLINDSPKNTLTFVSPSGGNQFSGGSMTPNDNVNPQVITIDLSGLSNWTGTQSSWWFQLVDNPGTGAQASAGTIHIQQILFVNQTLSVEDQVINKIALYPNPVKDLLTINSTLSIEKMEIYSILGRKITVQNGVKNTLDTSSLSKGVYLLKVYQKNNNISTRKFIKN